jgi:two-component system invasion response regulator UvrY
MNSNQDKQKAPFRAGGKRILLADDHPSIRNGAKLILANEFSEVEFGEAANAIEVFRKIKEKDWDILILDMDMPGRSGLEVLKQLKDEKSLVPVLMFSMHPESQVAVRALKSGASGYLAKDAASEELANAVRLILSGRKYITSSLAEQMATYMENPTDKAPHELLSDREYQTLLLFAKGKTVSQVAEEISLSVPTISTFRARILQKMNMKTNAELVEYAIRNNLV